MGLTNAHSPSVFVCFVGFAGHHSFVLRAVHLGNAADGATEQLSTGAKEQLGLIVRLAAAAMVSKEGGVPLVLDDALGSTDQGRIEAMGAVLRIASQGMQTIILTCAPERYVHVGAGVVVGMG